MSEIRSQLARLRVGEVVHLGGQLVDARRDDGAWIRTSLTRADAGAGACEVLLVRSVAVRVRRAAGARAASAAARKAPASTSRDEA